MRQSKEPILPFGPEPEGRLPAIELRPLRQVPAKTPKQPFSSTSSPYYLPTIPTVLPRWVYSYHKLIIQSSTTCDLPPLKSPRLPCDYCPFFPIRNQTALVSPNVPGRLPTMRRTDSNPSNATPRRPTDSPPS